MLLSTLLPWNISRMSIHLAFATPKGWHKTRLSGPQPSFPSLPDLITIRHNHRSWIAHQERRSALRYVQARPRSNARSTKTESSADEGPSTTYPYTGKVSQRKLKRSRGSPSELLVKALELTGNLHALPTSPSQSKRNLSYNDPRTRTVAVSLHQRRAIIRRDISLPMILAEYVQLVAAGYNPQSLDEYGRARLTLYAPNDDPPDLPEVLSYLANRGYGYEHVAMWTSILLAHDLDKSPLRRDAVWPQVTRDAKSVPVFLLGFILRRDFLSAAALKVVLAQVWWSFKQTSLANSSAFVGYNSKENSSISTTVRNQTITVLVIRLLRHARKVWPASIPSIIALLTEFIGVEYSRKAPTSGRNFITFMFNRMLRLLSLPCNMNPISSSPIQAKAQFNLLASMVKMQPPLDITWEGYRSVVLVQLACRKTAQEQDWASLKSRSWPPWKQSKTHMDEEKGLEYGTSRAGEVLIQMQQAGYPKGLWGKVADIYAGWDTDRSPTIQTRTARLGSMVRVSRKQQNTRRLWAARIDATRTLKEAWACFLSYEDSGLGPESIVYRAMFEKIYMDQKRRLGETFDQGDARVGIYPGDGLEVVEEPISPREATYVRVPPPTFTEFVDRMLERELTPDQTLLCFLVERVTTLQEGIKIMRLKLSNGQINALLSPDGEDSHTVLRSLPDRVLAAFIRLIAKPPGIERKGFPVQQYQQPRIRNQISHALNLVESRASSHPIIWNAFLELLLKHSMGGFRFGVAQHFSSAAQTARVLSSQNSVIQCMKTMQRLRAEIDQKGFQLLCQSICRSAATTHAAIPLIEHNGYDSDGQRIKSVSPRSILKQVQQLRQFFVSTVADDLRHVFAAFVGTAHVLDNWPQLSLKTIPSIPRLLNRPNAATLHHYVRALGFMSSHEGILELIDWIVCFQKELHRDSYLKPATMRHTLLAICAFLTGRLGASAPANEATVSKAREIAKGYRTWGDWPLPEDVDEYVETHMNPLQATMAFRNR